MSTDNAVALAEKHHAKFPYGEVLMYRSDFADMLADHCQQVISELAQRSGKMPHVFDNNGSRPGACHASEVREAIAAMQAQNEEHLKDKVALRAHIEAMQKDCRTCEHVYYDDAEPYGVGCNFANRYADQQCRNHDKYQPMLEFKQLTRCE